MKVEMRDLILGVLAIEPTLTLKQVAERIGKSTSTVEKAVAVLVKDGVAVEMAITPPPAQIRTFATNASGSYLESYRQIAHQDMDASLAGSGSTGINTL
ncbi:winged helix-turn-helix domain-containing protein [Aeromonas media]|uniref:winged helix-turn-helix domain-containing protein n=1 Tax=Aeromonas media TaxID=651 RepID=UPI00343EE963